ncbi:hypothetical protein HAPG_00013 [Halorubrum phage GNf2]|nr:hypothetical protein HAPG_00013 [Halorubrum phage GNf2]
MTWYPTNANDVKLIVSVVNRDESGSRTGTTRLADTSAVSVSDFTLGTEEDLSGLGGIGNPEDLGISQGDIEHTFSFTVEGEDAEVFNGLASDEDGRAVELEIIVKMEDFKSKLTGAKAGTRELSASSGDPIEYDVEGMSTGRTNGTLDDAE